ncbi:hypothetical protein JCM15519_02920 [Fundidesulfovibrio butyratiphilus]
MPDVLSGTNSYVTEDQADAYFESRLYATAWTGASEDDKAKALIMAAVLLDRHVVWQGAKADPSQAMEWPRVGVRGVDPASVPKSVQVAQCELALVLLGKDTTAQSDMPGLKRQVVDVLTMEYFEGAHAVKAIPDSIFALVAAYGFRAGGLGSITLRR